MSDLPPPRRAQPGFLRQESPQALGARAGRASDPPQTFHDQISAPLTRGKERKSSTSASCRRSGPGGGVGGGEGKAPAWPGWERGAGKGTPVRACELGPGTGVPGGPPELRRQGPPALPQAPQKCPRVLRGTRARDVLLGRLILDPLSPTPSPELGQRPNVLNTTLTSPAWAACGLCGLLLKKQLACFAGLCSFRSTRFVCLIIGISENLRDHRGQQSFYFPDEGAENQRGFVEVKAQVCGMARLEGPGLLSPSSVLSSATI